MLERVSAQVRARAQGDMERRVTGGAAAAAEAEEDSRAGGARGQSALGMLYAERRARAARREGRRIHDSSNLCAQMGQRECAAVAHRSTQLKARPTKHAAKGEAAKDKQGHDHDGSTSDAVGSYR